MPIETSRGRRPGAGWVHVTRGAHRRLDAPDPRWADLAAWQLVLPASASFTHLTAARLHDETGEFVARGDLWLVGTRRLHEYDGAHHLDRSRQRRDLKRGGRLDGAGWSRRGFTREDVLHQAVATLREVDEALARPHDPGRVRHWHALLRDSLFTPAGAAAFLGRLGRP